MIRIAEETCHEKSPPRRRIICSIENRHTPAKVSAQFGPYSQESYYIIIPSFRVD